MTLDHVKQVPGREYEILGQKQNYKTRKPGYADPTYRPPTKANFSIQSPTQIYPRETDALDIDSLKHDINIYFEENSPHQEAVISEVY